MSETVMPILVGALQLALFVLIAPAVVGTLRWFKARLQLRRGASPLQPYRDLFKLLDKKPVRPPRTASFIYAGAPYVVFACYALLGWAAPPLGHPSLYQWFVPLDLLAVVYLIGLARFALALAGMDTGAPFGGLGSSREMFMSVLAEPALILSIFALALQHDTTDVAPIIGNSLLADLHDPLAIVVLILLWAAVAHVALIEAGRLPIDNPATHLELTMVQKALHLEYSGRNLALLEWGEAMKLTFFLTLLGDLLVPRGLGDQMGPMGIGLAQEVLYVLKLLAAIGLLGLLEMTELKLRLRRVVLPGTVAIALALVAALIAGMA